MSNLLEVDGKLVVRTATDFYVIEFWVGNEHVDIEYINRWSSFMSLLARDYLDMQGDCKLVIEKTVEDDTVKVVLVKGRKRLWVRSEHPNSGYIRYLVRKFGGV
jgi:hypothetical protein